MDVTFTPAPFADAFLACDRIAKPGGALNSVHSPVTDARVNFGDLCAKMFAYGFVLLREEGAVELRLAEKKVLFVKSHFAQIHKKAETTEYAAPLPRLLECVQDGKSARDAIWRLIGDDMLSPWSFVASLAFQQAAEAGLVLEKKGGFFGKMATGIPKLELVTGKSDEISQRIETCAQRWEAFAKAEPELAERLVKDCYEGISSRTRQREIDVT